MLDQLTNPTINNQRRSAYQEPSYYFDGLEGPVTLREVLEYLLDNTGGGGGGGTDSYVASASLGAGNILNLTRNTGQITQVDLSVLAQDDKVTDIAIAGTTLTLTLQSGATESVDLASLQDGGENNTGSNVGGGDAGVFRDKTGVTLNMRTLSGTGGITVSENGDVVEIDGSGVSGGGGGLFQYDAESGAMLTATAQGATYARTGGAGQNTEGTLTLPEGGLARGLSVHMTAGQAPGNTFYLNVDTPYSSTPPVQNSQDTVLPAFATVSTKPSTFGDANPATNYVHSGTPLQVGIVQVDDNGSRIRVRYKITNYNTQVGSNPSIVTFQFT